MVTVSVGVISPPTGDFAIDAHPESLVLNAGASQDSTVVLKSMGFAGTVTLTVTVSPAVTNGPTVTLSTATVILKLNSAGTSILTISTTALTPNQDFVVTVTATAGSLSHSDQIFLSVGNFSITAGHSTLSLRQGSTGTFIITLTSDDFAGTVRLDATITPQGDHGPSATFTKPSVVLHSDRSAHRTLRVSTMNNTPSGTYIIKITATGGVLFRLVRVFLTVTHGNEDGAD